MCVCFCAVGCSPCNGCSQRSCLCDPLTSRCPASAQDLLWCCSTSGHSYLIGCLCLPQHKNISKVDYAMQSLKRAMKWDEVTAQLPPWVTSSSMLLAIASGSALY